VSVSLKRFQSERAPLTARQAPLGLRLKSDERASTIGHDAELFDLIVVDLPVFRDGRAFSTARLLRERYHYKGEIRASGHILPDQVLFLARCGVNSFDVKGDRRLDPYLEAFREYSVSYQPLRAGLGIAPALRQRSGALLAQAAE
jgi:uncharacterized protein (DUF934 family)